MGRPCHCRTRRSGTPEPSPRRAAPARQRLCRDGKKPGAGQRRSPSGSIGAAPSLPPVSRLASSGPKKSSRFFICCYFPPSLYAAIYGGKSRSKRLLKPRLRSAPFRHLCRLTTTPVSGRRAEPSYVRRPPGAAGKRRGRPGGRQRHGAMERAAEVGLGPLGSGRVRVCTHVCAYIYPHTRVYISTHTCIYKHKETYI